MKITRTFCFFTFFLLCLTVSIGANAQYGYQNGTYYTDPTSLPSGAGVACTSTTCNASLTAAGTFTAYYTTNLYWTATGSPTYSTTTKVWVNVSGAASSNGGASSRSMSNSPLGVTATGSAAPPNGSYTPLAKTAIANGQYPQPYTGALWCTVAGSGANSAAEITFGFN